MKVLKNDLIQSLTWTWIIKDLEVKSAIDESIQKAFIKKGYKFRPGQEYLFVTGIKFNPKADMTMAFIDTKRALATCYGCSQEHRGLHIHVFPRNDKKALDDLSEVIGLISKPVNAMSRLDYIISKATWNYKWIPFSAILVIINYLISQSDTIFNSSPKFLSTLSYLGFSLLMIYVVLVIVLVLVRIYYAFLFAWRT